MDLDITTPEGQVLITTDIETGMDGRVRTVLEIDAFGEKQTIEMVVAGPYVYVDVPDSGWTQMSADCLDIPGHRAGVRIESPLHVHTCKHGIWNQDGRFDVAALGNGVLLMPHYELCLQAENTAIGARLLLAECTQSELQTWTLQDSGEIALEAFPQVCITVEEGPGRDAGGPRYLIKGVGLDTCAQQASIRQRWTTVTP